jgi:aryl-alcohol dehydrogenase-like predicted oxidoreductase
MKYIKIDGLDIDPSCLGLGGWQIGGHGWGMTSEAELIKTIRKALDSGINFFDTAPIYGLGRSEELLAETLGKERDRVVIATKCGLRWQKDGDGFRKFVDNSPENITKELDSCLRRLKTGHIDLYQIHWPDPGTPVEETMAALERLKKDGKIRCIGCCNFSSAQLSEALTYGDIATIQVPYNLVDRDVEAELLPFCRKHSIKVIAYGPLAKGFLSGKYDAGVRFGSDDNRSRDKYFLEGPMKKNMGVLMRCRAVADAKGMTMAQVALRWVLENPAVAIAIFGAKAPAQVEDNAIAADLVFSDREKAYLNADGDSGRSMTMAR